MAERSRYCHRSDAIGARRKHSSKHCQASGGIENGSPARDVFLCSPLVTAWKRSPALAPCARQCARASARARGVGETRATAAAVSPDGGAVTSCPTGRSSGGGGTCGPVGRLACSGLRGVFVPVAGATRSSHRTMQNKSVSSAHEAPIRCVGLSQIGIFSHSARPEATLSLHTAHAQRSLRMTERLPQSALTARSLTPRSMQCAHTLARSERRRAPTRR